MNQEMKLHENIEKEILFHMICNIQHTTERYKRAFLFVYK